MRSVTRARPYLTGGKPVEGLEALNLQIQAAGYPTTPPVQKVTLTPIVHPQAS